MTVCMFTFHVYVFLGEIPFKVHYFLSTDCSLLCHCGRLFCILHISSLSYSPSWEAVPLICYAEALSVLLFRLSISVFLIPVFEITPKSNPMSQNFTLMFSHICFIILGLKFKSLIHWVDFYIKCEIKI